MDAIFIDRQPSFDDGLDKSVVYSALVHMGNATPDNLWKLCFRESIPLYKAAINSKLGKSHIMALIMIKLQIVFIGCNEHPIRYTHGSVVRCFGYARLTIRGWGDQTNFIRSFNISIFSISPNHGSPLDYHHHIWQISLIMIYRWFSARQQYLHC